MGMSQKEGAAYQALLDAVIKAMHETAKTHLMDDSWLLDLASEYLDFSGPVVDAAEKLVSVIIEENRANPDIQTASAALPAPEPPYF